MTGGRMVVVQTENYVCYVLLSHKRQQSAAFFVLFLQIKRFFDGFAQVQTRLFTCF